MIATAGRPAAQNPAYRRTLPFFFGGALPPGRSFHFVTGYFVAGHLVAGHLLARLPRR
jgi:hypothetical protein